MSSEEFRKLSQKELSRARDRVGAKRQPIVISDKEWEAIQAGAISYTKLSRIIKYVDDKRLKELAMPRTSTKISESKQNRLKAMANSGYTTAEIADTLGISTATVSKYLLGKE